MKTRRALTFGLLLGPWLVGWVWPWQLNRLNREAERAFTDGRFADAAGRWQEVLRSRGPDAATTYNLGTTQYFQENYPAAVETLGRALELARDDGLRNRIHYNRGNALYRLGQFDAAAREYEEAIRLDPEDEDAKFNLELCRRKSAEEQQQSPQGQGQGQGQGQSQPGGGSSGDGHRPPGQARPMTEAEVDRMLESLRRDEADFRDFFSARPSVGRKAVDPLDSTTDLEDTLRSLSGSTNERDW